MDAKSSDISTSFAGHPKNCKARCWIIVVELGVLDSSDT
jgi:hypothetical protein